MANSTPRARAERTAFDEIRIAAPWTPRRTARLVELLKAEIPYTFRSYDATTKTWLVWGGYQDLAVDLLLECFPDADVPRRGRTAGRWDTPAGDGAHYATLCLLPTAPPALIDAAYRCLAKLRHPDLGGDPAAMRRLTEAHDALSRRLSP